jgi:selenocysteine lyase/cysteine desulfurase
VTAPDRARSFRSQFPVFERVSYLNAGTEGPVPQAAVEAVQRWVELEATRGRSGRAHFEEVMGLAGRVRAGYARVLGCRPEEVALTGSTTDGVNTVIAGLDLRAGDEILTTDEEHPGLLAPLGRAVRRHGVKVRVVPFAAIAGEVTAATRLVACSHVSWVGGKVVDVEALAASPAPVLLDAAQAIGAVPADVHALGCDYYAASGQKWLCGPEGSGCLWVRPERLEELLIPWPGYSSVADPVRALEFEPAQGTARLDHGFPVALRSNWALAALEVLEAAGWEWVQSRAADLAAWLASALADRGLEVLPRGRSTLVSWRVPGEGADAQVEVERLVGEGMVVRSIPLGGYVRVSVGAWSSEEELERLVALVAPA